MSKVLRSVLFLVMSAAILATPISQIVKYERVLLKGRAYKFKTRPVDPVDAFRGRYVQLDFELRGRAPSGMTDIYRHDAYAALGENAAGFAEVRELSETPPAQGDWVKVEMLWFEDGSNRIVHVQAPFSQFFMNEKLAPEAEKAYRQLNRRGTTNVWAVVRVLNGKGVIENLMFDGMPAMQYLTNKERP